MLVLFFQSLFAKKHHSQTIFTLGILGTFVGISLGLYNFNPEDIDGSIPQLLSGLKTAFFTSILGMIFVVIIEFFKGKSLHQQSSGHIPEELKNSMHEFFDFMRKSEKEKESRLKENFDSANHSLRTIADNIAKHYQGITQEFRDQNTVITKSSEFIGQSVKDGNVETKKGFDNVDRQLQRISEDISQGASEAIVEALRESMDDFNNNLERSFGENFKQLNESCIKMIQWQKEYGRQVEQGVNQLNKFVEVLESSSVTFKGILKNSKESIQLSKEVEKLILGCNGHIESMTTLLREYKELAQGARSMFKSTEEGFKEINTGMKEFSNDIRAGLSSQSKAVSSLTKEIQLALPDSLNVLNTRLTDLTNQFVEAYETFLPRKK